MVIDPQIWPFLALATNFRKFSGIFAPEQSNRSVFVPA